MVGKVTKEVKEEENASVTTETAKGGRLKAVVFDLASVGFRKMEEQRRTK